MADYTAQGGGLKLKGVHDGGIKKKKKKKSKDKDKDSKRMLEQISSGEVSGEQESGERRSRYVDKRTAAERAFEKQREKRNAEVILQKAGKTHKERIIDFNKHLDTLTEHFDIPKVSWTK